MEWAMCNFNLIQAGNISYTINPAGSMEAYRYLLTRMV